MIVKYRVHPNEVACFEAPDVAHYATRGVITVSEYDKNLVEPNKGRWYRVMEAGPDTELPYEPGDVICCKLSGRNAKLETPKAWAPCKMPEIETVLGRREIPKTLSLFSKHSVLGKMHMKTKEKQMTFVPAPGRLMCIKNPEKLQLLTSESGAIISPENVNDYGSLVQDQYRDDLPMRENDGVRLMGLEVISVGEGCTHKKGDFVFVKKPGVCEIDVQGHTFYVVPDSFWETSVSAEQMDALAKSKER